MLTIVNESCFPDCVWNTPPFSTKPAAFRIDIAFAGLYAYVFWRPGLSQLENVGVTMPVWFAGGSYPYSPICETRERSIAYAIALRTARFDRIGSFRLMNTETFWSGGNQMWLSGLFER